MSVWTWLKFVTFLWLLRKGFKLARWLLVAVAAVAAWPVTVVAGTGYAAAWLRGWHLASMVPLAAALIRFDWLTGRADGRAVEDLISRDRIMIVFELAWLGLFVTGLV